MSDRATLIADIKMIREIEHQVKLPETPVGRVADFADRVLNPPADVQAAMERYRKILAAYDSCGSMDGSIEYFDAHRFDAMSREIYKDSMSCEDDDKQLVGWPRRRRSIRPSRAVPGRSRGIMIGTLATAAQPPSPSGV